MDKDLINQAIRVHGAQVVYAAACRHMHDGVALAGVGLTARSMGDVWAVQSDAYANLGDAARVIDHAQADAALTAIARGQHGRKT